MAAFVDDTRIQLDGRTGRVICARNRAGAAGDINTLVATPDAITEAYDQFGSFIRFAPLKGDVSSTDKDRIPPPPRAMIALEGMGLVDRYGKRLTQHFGLVVEPGPMVKLGAYCDIAQWNAAPGAGLPWSPPPCEFGIVPIQNAKKVWEEWLELKIRSADATASILSNEPLIRGKFYREIGIAFYDGRGGPGRAELWINGRQQGKTYRGPTGYAGYGSVFPAIGSYNHPGQVSPPPAVRIYGWREGPHA